MSTISKAEMYIPNNVVCQGDIYENVHYNYIESGDNDSVNIVEYVFPYAIVISQGCDVISMSEMETKKEGQSHKVHACNSDVSNL